MCEPLLNDSKQMKQHQPNNVPETIYMIDGKSKSDVMNQITNEGQLNYNDYERMDLATQQDVILSTLSNFLVEPPLSVPMTVGLYSRWGSGKTSYTQRLTEFMEEYRDQVPLKPFTITFVLTMACFVAGVNIGLIVSASAGQKAGSICGMCVGIGLIALFLFCRLSVTSSNNRIRNFAIEFTIFFHRFLIFLKMIYCLPPSVEEYRSILPVHLVMVEFSQKAVMAEDPITLLVNFTDALNDAVEKDLGIFIPRLYRIFQGTKNFKNRLGGDFYSHWKTSCCCIPSFMITVFIFLCLWIAIILYNIYGLPGPITVMAIQIACCCVFGGGLISYLLRTFLMTYCMCLPMKKRVQIVANRAGIHEDTFLSVLKHELDLYVDMVECIDGFKHRQTRIIVHIDLVDSLEQQKVLNIINSISLLITEPGYPFILVLSVDPRLLIKAIDQTLSNMQEPVLNPCEYLKNMVDLPCYINEYPKLRAEMVIPSDVYEQIEDKLDLSENEEEEIEWGETDDLLSGNSNVSEIGNGHVPLGDGTTSLQRSVKFPSDQSLTSVENQTMQEQEEESISEDISHLLRNNENNSLDDVKRIMNIVSLSGRILRYQEISFQWTRLAIWISFCDGWPYKASWLTLVCLDTTLNIPGNMTIRKLHGIFGFLMPIIGEKNLGMDNSNSYFDTFIVSHKPMINVNDIRSFAAFIFHIDPTIRKLMIDYLIAMRTKHAAAQQLNLETNPNDQFQWMHPVNPEVLIRMSVDDVVNQLLLIEGLNESLLQQYKSRLLDNNVNGRVLMACDLNDLRDVMQMKFGDWQLFRAWIMTSRNKDQQVSSRGDVKMSTDQSSSCADGSQTESNPSRTPKQSASGSTSKSLPRSQSRSKKADIKHVPYASHLTPQPTRKTLKDTKTSVSQDSDTSPPQHLNDHVLHHSIDSGFASTEVDQNHRLMLSLQRQSCVPEFEEPAEQPETAQLISVDSDLIAVHIEDFETANPNTLISATTEEPNFVLYEQDHNMIENTEDIATNTRSEILDESNDSISGNILIPVEDTPRPPSLSEVPLPPLSMLNDGVSWPMSPPAEFDDHPDIQPIPSPPKASEQSQINTTYPHLYKGLSKDCDTIILNDHKKSTTMSEPYAIDFTSGKNSSLKKSASVGYYDYDKKPSLRLSKSALGKKVLLDQDE